MRYFHYLTETGNVIRVAARRQPSEETKPRTYTWIVEEAGSDFTWLKPDLPEILWGRLKQLKYLGSIPAKGEE